MTRSFAERFATCCSTIVRYLPFGLNTLVPPSFVGFALINGCTFGVDLLLLTLGHGVAGLPLPVAITAAYVCAFALSFVLNRVVNFRSHAPVGPQVVRYAVAVAVNYAVFVLGAGAGLAALGLEYHLARIFAGACEAVFLYSVLRWIVFPGRAAGSTRGTRS